jgi:phosphoribosylamine--glycine ligase
MTERIWKASKNLGHRDQLSVLVVGSGAREHALVWALSRSPSVGEIWSVPGNPGIASMARVAGISVTDVDAITDWAIDHGIGLVVVGPEAPLALGQADRLIERGVPVFGPTRAAAELEWSKSYAKDFMQRHGIPTARYGVFSDPDAALGFAHQADLPLVVKADGLAAGKGVTICQSIADVEAAIQAALVDRTFGEAGDRVVVEGFLAGEELSVIALVDGERMALLPPARDYKRLRDGDEGPNTGGMGSYAPVCDLDPQLMRQIKERILQPTVDGLRIEGRPFRGALYAGLMLTGDGPQVLEFNCRFGDPETQVLVPLLDCDLGAVLLECATGQLTLDEIPLRRVTAVCVVLAAEGYPVRPRGGDVITGVDDAIEQGALVFQAGTAHQDSALVTHGGRVLSVVGIGDDLAGAAARAYDGAEAIQFAGKQSRGDIAAVPQPA